MIGTHSVHVQYGDRPVPGSPFTCNVYDAARVRVDDVPATSPLGLAVDIQGK